MKILSPAIKAASVFALGGAGFAIANLLLARNLSTHEYGQFALILAILNFGIPLASLGLDAAVVRHRAGPDKQVLHASIVAGVLTGTILAIAARFVYDIDVTAVSVLGVAVLGGGVTRAGAAVYQSEKRFAGSLWMMQSQHITLIIAALAAGLVAAITPTTVFAVLTTHWVVMGVLGWISLIYVSNIETRDGWEIPWREIPALSGYIITVQLAIQLDKLMLPKVLDIESLATYGVLSALVLAPFKVFESGVGFTLIPGLRTAATEDDRIRTILHEAKTTTLVIALGIVSGFFIAPWVASMFLAGKYELGNVLIGAAVFAGAARVMVVFVSSVVTALGSANQLTLLTRASWVSLLVSVLGAWWGAQWGLPGFISGFAVGSLARVALVSLIATQVWRAPSLSQS